MRKGDGAAGDHADHAVASAAGSAGHELPNELRSRFEGALGTDLSDVRVHTGGESQAAAAAVGARAYTVGNDVHFGAGEYDPDSERGQHLLAHEVAHTVQQRGGAAHRQHKLTVSQASDPFEVEADRAADAMVRGTPVSLSGASIGLARKETPPPAAADGSGEEKKKDKSEYPSWKNDVLDIPLGSLGSLKFKAVDGKQSTSLEKKAKVTALSTGFKHKYSMPYQLAPGVSARVEGEIKADVSLTGSASASATWSRKDGETQDSLTLAVAGTGELGLSATGSLKLTAGVGVAKVVSVEGGIKGELSATAKGSLSMTGALTKAPSGTETGVISAIAGVSAELKAGASLVVDFVKPGDAVTLYEQRLGEIVLGQAGMTSTVTYQGGKAIETEPKYYAKWIDLPKKDARPRRPLNEKEKQQYVYNGEVEHGASGASAGLDQPPEDVEMSDEEIYKEGRALATSRLTEQHGKLLPVTDQGPDRMSTFGVVRHVKVKISGSEVSGTAWYPLREEDDARKGRKLRKITSGVVENGSISPWLSIDIMKTCAKQPEAVARAILAKYADVTMMGTAFEWDEVPSTYAVQASGSRMFKPDVCSNAHPNGPPPPSNDGPKLESR